MEISESYQTQIIIKSSQKRIFRAITKEIDQWWGKTDSKIGDLGDSFIVSWGAPWYMFKIVAFNPDGRMVWECVDANQIISGLEGVQREWVGTTIHWNIIPIDGEGCELTIIHKGLIPEMICYEVCSTTWDRYIHLELKKYLESGVKG